MSSLQSASTPLAQALEAVKTAAPNHCSPATVHELFTEIGLNAEHPHTILNLLHGAAQIYIDTRAKISDDNPEPLQEITQLLSLLVQVVGPNMLTVGEQVDYKQRFSTAADYAIRRVIECELPHPRYAPIAALLIQYWGANFSHVAGLDKNLDQRLKVGTYIVSALRQYWRTNELWSDNQALQMSALRALTMSEQSHLLLRRETWGLIEIVPTWIELVHDNIRKFEWNQAESLTGDVYPNLTAFVRAWQDFRVRNADKVGWSWIAGDVLQAFGCILLGFKGCVV